MIKLEQEKIKARRKIEAKRRNLKQRSFDRVSRTGLTARFLEEGDLDDDEMEADGTEQDDYDDDFIDDTQVDGDGESQESVEEEEEQAEESDIGSSDQSDPNLKDKAEEGHLTRQPSKRVRRTTILDDEDEE